MLSLIRDLAGVLLSPVLAVPLKWCDGCRRAGRPASVRLVSMPAMGSAAGCDRRGWRARLRLRPLSCSESRCVACCVVVSRIGVGRSRLKGAGTWRFVGIDGYVVLNNPVET